MIIPFFGEDWFREMVVWHSDCAEMFQACHPHALCNSCWAAYVLMTDGEVDSLVPVAA